MDGNTENLSPCLVFENIQSGLQADLSVYYCGSEDCKPGKSWGPLVRDHYVLHYIRSGRGIYRISGREYALSRGQVFVIFPGDRVYYCADSEQPWAYSWFGFCGSCMDGYLGRCGISPENPVCKGTAVDTGPLEEAVGQIVGAGGSRSNRDLLLLAGVYSFMYILAESSDPQSVCAYENPVWELYIKKAVEFIQQNYSRRICVQDISDYIGIDRKYLSYLFGRYLGISPSRYLMNFRVEKACRIMKDDRLPVKEIAYSVGYEDPLAFSKLFKKLKGIAPREYHKGP